MEKRIDQRARDVLKIVFYGPESTGKTTLAKKMAAHFNTTWVPEFARGYLQEKWDKEQKICEREDILSIAKGQLELEKSKVNEANKVLFCDTNLLESLVYSQAYFDGYCEPSLLKQALNAHYDLYFLTYIDVPWVADDLRDRPHDRDIMFANFKKPLDELNLPYRILSGTHEERFQAAVKIIEELIKNREIGL